MSRMLFLDPHCRELYVDWKRNIRTVVGNLRIAVRRHPDDPLLAELIGELTTKSTEFVALWGDHRVHAPQPTPPVNRGSRCPGRRCQALSWIVIT